MSRPRKGTTFWDRVNRHLVRKGDCLVFTGHLDDYGYGRVKLDGQKKLIRVHRAAWMRDHGPIPEGKVVMHTCDNRACIEPEHLQIGTQIENIKDMHRKERAFRIPYSQDYVF